MCANLIAFVPNVIERTFEFDELNIPVVRSNPFKFNVPWVSVNVPVPVNLRADAKLVITPELLIMTLPKVVLLLELIVPLATMFAVILLKFPLPIEDSIKLLRFNVANAGNVALPVKSSML